MKTEIDIKNANIQRDVKEVLQGHGWFVFENANSECSCFEIAPLCAVKDGRTLWMNVQIKGNRITYAQKRFKARIEEKGGECYTVHTVGEALEIING